MHCFYSICDKKHECATFVLQKFEEMDTVRQCLRRLRSSVPDEDHRTLNTLEEVRKTCKNVTF